MNASQKRSQSLKIYWRSAVERRNKMSIGMKGENNPAKLPAVRIKAAFVASCRVKKRERAFFRDAYENIGVS
jgi:hypothetical protein